MNKAERVLWIVFAAFCATATTAAAYGFPHCPDIFWWIYR